MRIFEKKLLLLGSLFVMDIKKREQITYHHLFFVATRWCVQQMIDSVERKTLMNITLMSIGLN